MTQDSSATRRLCLHATFLLMLAIVSSSCVKLPRRYALTPIGDHLNSRKATDQGTAVAPLININTASREELEKLPGIGQALAARIIAHREQYGRFRRAEHLIMVRGIGDRRFRKMLPFIMVG